MNKSEFKESLSSLKTATSVKGKRYSSMYVEGEKIYFVREGKTQFENISINELFSFFSQGEVINTSTAKSYISGRVQSPAVAILRSLKKAPANTDLRSLSKKITPPKQVISQEKLNDETKFFLAFSEIVGEEFLLSKSIGKPIKKYHVFLSNNYKDYSFQEEINEAYVTILTALKSNFTFSSESLSHFVDGLLINHPFLGTRIVEFDEEQHFTPARKDTSEVIQKVTNNSFPNSFLEICKDLDYLNEEVLPKHRIKNQLKEVPQNFISFVDWLVSSNEKDSGYICSKNGFLFLGGRMAQRAYYDCLRDTAHLSDKNKNLSAPLRFAKKSFEDIAKMEFKSIPQNELKQIISDQIKSTYNIELD